MHSYFIADLFGSAEVQISENDYYSFKNDIHNVGILWQVEDLFTLLANSFIDFEELLLSATLKHAYCYSEGHDLHTQFDENRQDVNLKIISILTSARIYEEQIHQLLPKLKLPDRQTINLKPAFSTEFDGHLEYRVMYALRNHALHSQLPIISISYGTKNISKSGSIVDGSPTHGRHTITPGISVKDFINSEKVRSKTRDEVAELNYEFLDAKFFVRGYISCLYRIHETFRTQSQELFENCIGNLKQVEAKLEALNDQTDKLSQIEERKDGHRIKECPVSHSHNLRLRSVRKYWSGFGSLQRRHVASIVTSKNNTYPETHDKIWIPK